MTYEFKTNPYPHQKVAFEMAKDAECLALFMEQGTGKTKVIIDNAAYLYEQGKINAILVVAPNGVHLNWVRNEIPTHMPDRVPWFGVAWDSSNRSKKYMRGMSRLFAGKSELKVFTINVEAMSAKRGHEAAKKFLESFPKNMAVIDESSKIKNPRAKRTKAVVNLRKLSPYFRRILTGTPVTQSPLDVYPQLYFLHPHILGFTSFYTFKHHYAKIIQKQAVDGSGRTYKYEDVVGYQHLDEMRDRIQPYSFRVTKAECLKDLPEKIYTQIPVMPSPKQKQLYKKLVEELLLEIGDEELPIPLVLTRMLRLQQLTGGFIALEDGSTVPIEGSNPKMLALLSDIEDLPTGESAIIWARFVAEVKMILSTLRGEYGYTSAGAYYGATSRKDRAELVDSFQAGETRFFVGNPQAAGMGLTLHKAATVYYFSNDFSFENRSQSEDRAHRIGQKKNVVYKDIVCAGTIDEKVLHVLREKKNLADIVTGDVQRLVRSLVEN